MRHCLGHSRDEKHRAGRPPWPLTRPNPPSPARLSARLCKALSRGVLSAADHQLTALPPSAARSPSSSSLAIAAISSDTSSAQATALATAWAAASGVGVAAVGRAVWPKNCNMRAFDRVQVFARGDQLQGVESTTSTSRTAAVLARHHGNLQGHLQRTRHSARQRPGSKQRGSWWQGSSWVVAACSWATSRDTCSAHAMALAAA